MTFVKLILCAAVIGSTVLNLPCQPAKTGLPAADLRSLTVAARLDAPVHFETVSVYLDTGEKSLAAYQIELRATTGNVLLAGIEGGDHPAFAKPPYYDAHALLDERIVLAALSTDTELPAGKTRVARLTVQVTGEIQPQYQIKLHTAGGADGTPIPATAIVGSASADAKP